jgi:hypothetical protein
VAGCSWQQYEGRLLSGARGVRPRTWQGCRKGRPEQSSKVRYLAARLRSGRNFLRPRRASIRMRTGFLDFRQSEPRHPLAPLPWCWTCKPVPGSAVTEGNVPCTELVDPHGFFAGLVLHQVRPDHRSAVADAVPQNHFSHDPKPGARSVAVADIESTSAPGSAKPSPMPEAATSHPLPTPLETLFTELAHRRVCKLAIREKP